MPAHVLYAFLQRIENLVCTVLGSTLDNGYGAVFWPEESHRLYDTAHQSRDNSGRLIQVQREEIFDFVVASA